MGIVFAIVGKDIREVFRNKSVYLYVAFLFFIAFPYLDGLRSTLARAADQSPGALASASREFVNGMFATLPLTLSMLFCTYLSAYAIVLEKAKRTIESLLATPASLRQVWMGKNLGGSLAEHRHNSAGTACGSRRSQSGDHCAQDGVVFVAGRPPADHGTGYRAST